MLSLFAWAKREGLTYSVAHKRFLDGEIEGAVKEGTRIKVPEETKSPVSARVSCAVCGAQLSQITATHLGKHNLTFDQYTATYPDVLTCSAEVGEKISKRLTGRTHSAEHRANNSKAKIGSKPWNAGQTGLHHDTPETKQRKSKAQIGRKHSEETKKAIGDAHRGKILSAEQVANMRIACKKYIEEHGHPMLGKKQTEDACKKMSAGMLKVFAAMSPERIAELAENRAKKTRGLKRTEEQKETYRVARCKWMSENPTKLMNTTGERSVIALLTDLGIDFVQQFLIPGLNHPFDFYVPDFNTIIEFDGAHHWLGPWFNILGKSSDERDAMLVAQKAKDAKETAYAIEHGFKVVRVFGIADVGDADGLEPLEEQLLAQGFLQDDTISQED